MVFRVSYFGTFHGFSILCQFPLIPWFFSLAGEQTWLSILHLLCLLWATLIHISNRHPGVQFEVEFGIILLQLFLAAHLFSCYWMLLGHYEQLGLAGICRQIMDNRLKTNTSLQK